MCVDFDEIECASGDNHITMKIALTMAIGVSFAFVGIEQTATVLADD
tara:strand:+ start:423 stop:563 length:141 start_codon:yes stop_codon:yes gene_type:complete